jgi:hypothetical protein
MRTTTIRTKRAGVFLLLFAFALIAAGRAAEVWTPLLNGRDLGNWDMFMASPDPAWDVPGMARAPDGGYPEPVGRNKDPLKVFTFETIDGRPALHVTGQGFGTILTKQSYRNFHLRLEVKWGERKWGYKKDAPRDCGLVYFCHGEPDAVDGTWPRSVEFQIQEHDMGDLYALLTRVTVRARDGGAYDPAGKPTLFASQAPSGNRCAKLGDPEKPHGEWNTLDLYCFGADSMHVVNGTVVMRLHSAERIDGGKPAPLTSGRIGLQTEGAEVYYRNVTIAPITAMPAEFTEP